MHFYTEFYGFEAELGKWFLFGLPLAIQNVRDVQRVHETMHVHHLLRHVPLLVYVHPQMLCMLGTER